MKMSTTDNIKGIGENKIDNTNKALSTRNLIPYGRPVNKTDINNFLDKHYRNKNEEIKDEEIKERKLKKKGE